VIPALKDASTTLSDAGSALTTLDIITNKLTIAGIQANFDIEGLTTHEFLPNWQLRGVAIASATFLAIMNESPKCLSFFEAVEQS